MVRLSCLRIRLSARICATIGFIVAILPSAGFSQSARTFKVGDSIQSDRHLNVRNKPAGEKLGVQVNGRFGKVIEGPTKAAIEGTSYTWWKVDWEIGIDGWCATVGLSPVAIDLNHGNAQVEAMLRDRPLMASFKNADGEIVRVTKDDAIWHWVASRFGTQVNGHRIFWDNSDVKKPDHYEADHTIPWKNQHGQIRLRSRIRKSPKDPWVEQSLSKMWSSVIFELMNVSNAGGFLRLWEDAKAGELTREAYVEGNQRLEYIACVALKNFYHTHFQPWAVANKFEPVKGGRSGDGFYLWIPESYEAWINSYTDGSYDYFFTYFDGTIVPYLKKKGRYDPKKHARR